MKSLSLLRLLAMALPFFACRSSAVLPVAPAFYYWQNTFRLSPAQLDYLEETASHKLYIKIADIGMEAGGVAPYSKLRMADTTGLARFEIVRVVFLTNEVFRKINPEETDWLAGKVAELFTGSSIPGGSAGRFECQIDCDWTNTTREAFFRFLRQLRAKLPSEALLSATIRLHQFKFPDQTGVPPVERGILMCYNTGDIENVATPNSILDLNDARKFIQGAQKHYPLPLDLALPVFSWLLVYRDEELWKIIPGTHSELPEGLLEKGTFLSGHYLRPGDILRREKISADLLKNAAKLCAGAGLADDATLAFFHLDAATLRDYPAQLIDSVCNITNAIREKK